MQQKVAGLRYICFGENLRAENSSDYWEHVKPEFRTDIQGCAVRILGEEIKVHRGHVMTHYALVASYLNRHR